MGEQHISIGIDVGGTGIKGAAIDVLSGAAVTTRYRVPTPAGGAPADIARAVGEMTAAIRRELSGAGIERAAELPVGAALPGVVRQGIMHTAANIDAQWIGADAQWLLSEAAGAACLVVNDADAAGIAESLFGAARGELGTTLLLTFGTGIGSALLHDGVLVPNVELGHLELDGHPDIERFAAAKVIEREGIALAEWAGRVERLLIHLELILNPDRFVIGGSISKAADQYLPFAGVTAPVLPAHLRNNAGIVGAAWLAATA